ncbi:MAG: response regulator [Holophaga sp.]|nr:response regulator [Holophaga sp.]
MKSKTHAGTILLADDEPLVRKNACAILGEAGFQVIEAVDGQDALVRYQTYHDDISLVIMDIHMPRLSGLSAAAKIKELDPLSKIIFISGSTLQAPSEEVADGFLTKPLRGRDLLNTVQRVLRETRLQGPYANGL